MSNTDFRFPGDKQRLIILGATGSGKTNDAMWHLSQRNIDEKPWVIYNFKNDELIDSIPGFMHIEPTQEIPQRPGVYVVHPDASQIQEVDNQMLWIWKHENIGVFVDEGFMIPRNSTGFRNLLTQGRSKHIPMITCSQRPAWMDRFTFSEADFIQMFRLQDTDDIKTVERFIPNPNADAPTAQERIHPIRKRLDDYWSYYYDVGRNKLAKVGPCPDPDAIVDIFDIRLRKIRKVI